MSSIELSSSGIEPCFHSTLGIWVRSAAIPKIFRKSDRCNGNKVKKSAHNLKILAAQKICWKESAHNLSVQAVLSQKKLFSSARRESKPRLPPVIRSSLKNNWPRRESNPRLPRRLYSTVVFRQNIFLEFSDKNSCTVVLNKYYPRIMNFRGRLYPGNRNHFSS